MIRINDLSKSFPGVTALRNVTLEVRDGEFLGLLGPNGAGKSTLMNLLIGYLNPDGGEIYVGDEKVSRDNLAARRNVGLVPQSLALYDDISAQENLEIFGSLYHIDRTTLKERIEERLRAVQLYDRRKDKVKTFSGGMKRRLNLISSLLHDPALLLCDEPTVGVDPQSRNAIFDYLELLNREGKTIVYTTHYMEEAERLCSRIAIIDSGAIVAEGTLDHLLGKLAYEETISIAKNGATNDKLEVFRKFGTVIDEEERFELKPGGEFHLSSFFSCMEQQGISPRSIQMSKPTLEALFLHLTGRSLRD
jgi:ABC-2 type transport system ATP-binding protein